MSFCKMNYKYVNNKYIHIIQTTIDDSNSIIVHLTKLLVNFTIFISYNIIFPFEFL